MNVEFRNSKAQIAHNMTVKLGDGLHAQGFFMSAHPDVFVKVPMVWVDGYAMPTMQEADLDDVVTALNKLELLWTKRTQTDRCISSADYQDYLHNIQDIPRRLRQALDDLFSELTFPESDTALSVHGDATIENIVSNGSSGWWIDPSVRPVPFMRSLDVAKVLQSRYGYAGPLGSLYEEAIDEWIREQNLPQQNIDYHLVGHLIRLWNLQPKRQGWALDVITQMGF